MSGERADTDGNEPDAHWRSRSPISGAQLRDELRALGLRDGDIVVVHSSLSGLGHVVGGAETVVDVLLDAVAPTGAMLFPTLTGTEMDGPAHPPVIELAATPCWTGIIPETARQRPDAVRSIHPTHSVAAIGARAREVTQGHERGESPCDAQSPWYRLLEMDGKILFLGGVSHESNTTLHALEERASVPYHLQPDATVGVVHMPDGPQITVPNYLHLWRWDRAFNRISGPLVAAGVETDGAVGASRAALVSASGLRDVVLPLIRREPLYLLAPTARDEFRVADVP